MSKMTMHRSPLGPVSERLRELSGKQGNRMIILAEGRVRTEIVKMMKEELVPVPAQDQEKVILRSPDNFSRSAADDLSSSSEEVSPISSECVAKVTAKTLSSVSHSRKAASVYISPLKETPKRRVEEVHRCAWITRNSDPLYTCFHDEEWGLPVYDDRKLFELLVYSMALAELNWPAILQKRDAFRNAFNNFDPTSVAEFKESKVLSLRANKNVLLSEQKLWAVVENAKQLLKVQHEFGSFSKYCWRFVNKKPIRNCYRYVRQVPVKNSKAELISKDLIQRGFCCVGPTVIYSFMQSVGMVNDHLMRCFRYQECNNVTVSTQRDTSKAQSEVSQSPCPQAELSVGQSMVSPSEVENSVA